MSGDREVGRVTLQYDETLADEIARRRQELQRLERQFSEDAARQTGLTVGEVLRNPDTGATYRVERVSVSTGAFGSSRVAAYVTGRRTYATGRSDANSTTVLSLSELRRTEGTS